MAYQGSSAAYRVANEHQACRLQAKQPLVLLYDFATCESKYDELGFVHDAGRPPLKALDHDAFLEVYGLPRKLAFGPYRVRAPCNEDWWAGVY